MSTPGTGPGARPGGAPGERDPLEGRILALCSGPGGIPKFPIERAEVQELGIVGDQHRFRLHGGPNRALCLLSIEEVRSLERDGVPVRGPGSFGENVLTEGIDFRRLAPGDRLALGDPAQPVLIELHDVREPCRTLCSLDKRFPDLMLGRSGFVARVLKPGLLFPGQPIRRL